MRSKQLLRLTINSEKREAAAYRTRTLLEVLREDPVEVWVRRTLEQAAQSLTRQNGERVVS